MGLMKRKKEPEIERPPEVVQPSLLEQLTQELAAVEAELLEVDQEFEKISSERQRVLENKAKDSEFARSDIERLYNERLENKETFTKFLDNIYKHKISSAALIKQTLSKIEAAGKVVGSRRAQLRRKVHELRKQIEGEENRLHCEKILEAIKGLLEHLKEAMPRWKELKKLRLGADEKFLAEYLQNHPDPWARYYLQVIMSHLKIQYLPDLGISDFVRYCMLLKVDSPTGKPILEPDYTEINAKGGVHSGISTRHEPSIVGNDSPLVAPAEQ